jgi:hypothetical protein
MRTRVQTSSTCHQEKKKREIESHDCLLIKEDKKLDIGLDIGS